MQITHSKHYQQIQPEERVTLIRARVDAARPRTRSQAGAGQKNLWQIFKFLLLGRFIDLQLRSAQQSDFNANSARLRGLDFGKSFERINRVGHDIQP